jgi:hypothetical protein
MLCGDFNNISMKTNWPTKAHYLAQQITHFYFLLVDFNSACLQIRKKQTFETVRVVF